MSILRHLLLARLAAALTYGVRIGGLSRQALEAGGQGLELDDDASYDLAALQREAYLNDAPLMFEQDLDVARLEQQTDGAELIPMLNESLPADGTNNTNGSQEFSCQDLELASKAIHRRSELKGCLPCHLGASSTRLFVMERQDGLGERADGLVYSLALADKYNVTFGGFLKNRISTSHGVKPAGFMELLLGIAEPRDLYFTPGPGDMALRPHLQHRIFYTVHEMEDAFKYGFNDTCEVRAIVLMTGLVAYDVDHYLEKTLPLQELFLDSYFSPRFRQALYRGSRIAESTPDYFFAKDRLSVAMHLRRGDVNDAEVLRGVPDSWYLNLTDTIRARFPDADIHVFTNSMHRHFDFSVYYEKNITIHDNNSIVSDWAHLSTAHIMVLTKSSFSHIPGLINQNCVIYKRMWHLPLSHWTDGDWVMGGTPGDDRLDKCISQIPAEVARQALPRV